MMIPFVDLKAQFEEIRSEINSILNDVFNESNFILGPHVVNFENHFAAYCNVKHAIAVNSGTSALHLALLAAGIQPGDEVITVAMTFVATIAAITYCGAKPVLIDVDAHSWNMDPKLIEKAITPRTKAILPVHLHGRMADMDYINAIAKKYNLIVIEDACQAHGAMQDNKMAGSIGDINVFSFYPTKNLGAYGEGGAVVTNDEKLATQVRLFRDAGSTEKYHHKIKGFNYRMEALQGAILEVKLKYLEKWIIKRQEIAQWYYENLQTISGLQLPQQPQNGRHAYHIFAIRTSRRNQIRQKLLQRGVMTSVHYPIPVHLQEGFADLGYQQGSLPVTEQLADELLSLPMFPELTKEQVIAICNHLHEIVEEEQINA